MLDWDWFQDANTFRVFIYCLLKANHEPKKWQGVEIKKGQFVTSYEKIASDLNIGVQSVRTSIKKLNLTGELTNKSTSRYSIITVKNWIRFQETNKQTNTQLTGNQQTTNKQLTTNKNEKNEKNDKKERNNSVSLSDDSKFLNCDLMFDKNVNKVFDFYSENCKALVPLKFEKRDLELRQTIKDFLFFIDFDFSYFFELCQKANEQVFLLDNKIDLKSLIKNHSRIYSGFYKAKPPQKTDTKKTTADIVASVKARMEATNGP
ncbi:MAG: hypothetical protein II306_06430 [Clostridia bacterium]|nr:hypothetical protein [Clostridia bacterium]